jgi:hypothetical protein
MRGYARAWQLKRVRDKRFKGVSGQMPLSFLSTLL